jgi:hypothetical protein
MLAFTTNDVNCPVESYQLSVIPSGTKSAYACPTIPDDNLYCRRAWIQDISIIADYVVKFKIKAKGGNEIETGAIKLSVVCSTAVVVTTPYIIYHFE